MRDDSNNLPNESSSADRPAHVSSQTWIAKFKNASRGLSIGILGRRPRTSPNSFFVHIPAATIVLAAGWFRGLDSQWMAILCGCIAIVWITELFNTSIECVARAITNEYHHEIRDALDIASGAVWLASLFAVVVGAIAFFG